MSQNIIKEISFKVDYLFFRWYIYFIEWKKWVRFGVINCAQADKCNDFNIQGTPTVRIIYPDTASNIRNYGLDIESVSNTEYWKNIVFQHVEISQAKGKLPKERMPNLIPLR